MKLGKWSFLTIGVLIVMMIMAMVAKSAVSTVAGLAVAASSGQWTNLKDASFGDGATNGVAMTAPMLWNGTSFVRALGDATNGTKVNVVAGSVGVTGTTTPSDAFANPTNALNTFSLTGIWNGSTWDRMTEPTADAMAGTGLLAIGPTSWNGTTWDRYTQVWPVATSCSAVAVTGACTTQDHHLQPKATHTWTTVVTGAPTSVNVNLEGSLDNTSFFTLDSSTTTTSEMRHVAQKGVNYIRGNVTVLSGGVSPTVTVKILDLGTN